MFVWNRFLTDHIDKVNRYSDNDNNTDHNDGDNPTSKTSITFAITIWASVSRPTAFSWSTIWVKWTSFSKATIRTFLIRALRFSWSTVWVEWTSFSKATIRHFLSEQQDSPAEQSLSEQQLSILRVDEVVGLLDQMNLQRKSESQHSPEAQFEFDVQNFPTQLNEHLSSEQQLPQKHWLFLLHTWPTQLEVHSDNSKNIIYFFWSFIFFVKSDEGRVTKKEISFQSFLNV